MSGRKPSAIELERLVADLDGALSPCEIQVCARALLGVTRSGIGLDLGLKETTVSTLRGRAYEKLDMSSIHELFALYLAHSASRSGHEGHKADSGEEACFP